jgi:hypothetical protein
MQIQPDPAHTLYIDQSFPGPLARVNIELCQSQALSRDRGQGAPQYRELPRDYWVTYLARPDPSFDYVVGHK